MWLLNWLPNWIFYAIGFVGLIGLFLTYLLQFIPIPAISMYKTPIQLVSIVLIGFATYMSGGIANEAKWNAKRPPIIKVSMETGLLNKTWNGRIL